MIEEAGRKLAHLGSGFDIQWAAIRGTQLGLVEARGDGVLFQRPLLQAYLGSRLIGAAMEDPEYRSTAMAVARAGVPYSSGHVLPGDGPGSPSNCVNRVCRPSGTIAGQGLAVARSSG